MFVLILALSSGRKQSVTLSFSKHPLHTTSFHSPFLDQHLFTEPSSTLSIHPPLHSSDTTLVAVFQRVWWKGPDTNNSNICASVLFFLFFFVHIKSGSMSGVLFFLSFSPRFMSVKSSTKEGHKTPHQNSVDKSKTNKTETRGASQAGLSNKGG